MSSEIEVVLARRSLEGPARSTSSAYVCDAQVSSWLPWHCHQSASPLPDSGRVDRPFAGGFDVRLNPNVAGVTVQQAQMLILQWNENIVDMLADAGRGAGDGSMKYYLGGQLVAQNKKILDRGLSSSRAFLTSDLSAIPNRLAGVLHGAWAVLD